MLLNGLINCMGSSLKKYIAPEISPKNSDIFYLEPSRIYIIVYIWYICSIFIRYTTFIYIHLYITFTYITNLYIYINIWKIYPHYFCVIRFANKFLRVRVAFRKKCIISTAFVIYIFFPFYSPLDKSCWHLLVQTRQLKHQKKV